jgi:hypothetical protein
MLNDATIKSIRKSLLESMRGDIKLLEDLRNEIGVLANNVRNIFPRSTTSISLVATDGGNNKLEFDPFTTNVIRVVDSSNNEYYMDVITPTTPIEQLNNKVKDDNDGKFNSLRKMMAFLNVNDITQLSPMIRKNSGDRPISPTWVQVYRELVEWATLFSIVCEKDFATDTLIVFDGQLRSKVFTGDLFNKLKRGIEDAVENHYVKTKRKIYIVGVAKHSKVLDRYKLAMHLDGIMASPNACYVEVPRGIEQKAYVWSEYARDDNFDGKEVNKFVAGRMFFVKFGNNRYDPIWPIDILSSQVSDAGAILGYLLADALNGFPVPFYPLSLQKAHNNAALVGFDMDILQNQVINSIKEVLGDEGAKIDSYMLVDQDPAAKRYG